MCVCVCVCVCVFVCVCVCVCVCLLINTHNYAGMQVKLAILDEQKFEMIFLHEIVTISKAAKTQN